MRYLGAAKDLEMSCLASATASAMPLWAFISCLFCSMEDGLEEDKTGGRETASSVAQVQYAGDS